MTENIRSWLDKLGLGKYADAFIYGDIEVGLLPHLSNDDLKELGVSVGNRIRLLNAIRGDVAAVPATITRAVTAPSMVKQATAPLPRPESRSDAERRPLTVMFCDLADSTALSTRLDPEDLQDVIRAYQETCAAIITEYGGYIARYMGDGILVYYGYPKSLERNAERAVRSALAIVAAMVDLNRKLARDHGIEAAVRLGIATGMVMVGEVIGEGMAQERTVVGEAPNMAARLQSLADRNGIVIGSLTRDLTGEVAVYKDMGKHELKGITGLTQTWGVVGLRDDTADDARQDDNDGGTAVPVLVGRDEEIGLLRRAWQSVQEEGRGQVVSISGEAGIGKSVLVDGLRARARAKGLGQLVMRCSPYHANSAFYPIIDYFKRAAGWQPEDDAAVRLGKLEAFLEPYDQPVAETLPLLAALLSLSVPTDRYPATTLSPKQQKEQIQDLCISMILENAERQPVLQLWEDLHWADPSTLELIGIQIDQAPTAALLMLLTTRPEFVPPWPARSHTTPITLNRLESQHTAALVARLAGMKPLPGEVVDHIVTKADGVPLYVEELTKTILASDILRDTGDRYELTGPLASLSIPDTLQESLMARLDRLPQVRELAQLGSVLGREFAYEMISGLSTIDESVLQDGLEQLVDAELLYQRGRPPRAKYIFKHALVQDAAYGSLLRRTREQHHLQVAQLMESRFPEIIETNPELIAHHYAEAGEAERAIDYFLKAGRRSLRTSANREAIAHLTKGLEIVKVMPVGLDRDSNELNLLIILGPALIATKGYASADVEPIYRRALDLCRATGDVEKEFSVVQGLSVIHYLRADLHKSRELAEQLVQLAKSRKDPGPDLAAARSLGYALVMLGEFEDGRLLFDRVSSSYDRDIHDAFSFSLGGANFGVGGRGLGSWNLFALGYPDQARSEVTQALTLAQEISHPFSEAFACFTASCFGLMCGDLELARESAKLGVEISTDKGFPQYVYWNKIPLHGALCELGEGEVAEHITGIRETIEALRAIGSNLINPIWLAQLALAYAKNGQPEDGLAAIAEALDEISRTDERFWEANLHRLKGEILLQSDAANAVEGEACFHKAIEVAQSQNAKGWELRAATSLARLWLNQGKTATARDLLQPVYDWFTEGFDTVDLKDAKQLLDDLG